MTFDMVKTEFEGFSIQHSKDLIQPLNEVTDKVNYNNRFLIEMGQSISNKIKHVIHPKTSDGYTWFGGLKYKSFRNNVAILFPWYQDFDNETSKMDRSINVYSKKGTSEEKVKELLEEIIFKFELAPYKQTKIVHWK